MLASLSWRVSAQFSSVQLSFAASLGATPRQPTSCPATDRQAGRQADKPSEARPSQHAKTRQNCEAVIFAVCRLSTCLTVQRQCALKWYTLNGTVQLDGGCLLCRAGWLFGCPFGYWHAMCGVDLLLYCTFAHSFNSKTNAKTYYFEQQLSFGIHLSLIKASWCFLPDAGSADGSQRTFTFS